MWKHLWIFINRTTAAHLAHHDISFFHSWDPLSHRDILDLLIIIKPLRTVQQGKYRTCARSWTDETPPALFLYQSLWKTCWHCFLLWGVTVGVFPFLSPLFSGVLHLIGNVSSWEQEQSWHFLVKQNHPGETLVAHMGVFWASWVTLLWLVGS